MKRFAAMVLFSLFFALVVRLPVADSPSLIHYGVDVAFPNLVFSKPVGIYDAGDGTDRLFVVQQNGLIYVFNNSRTVNNSEVLLDISNRVLFGGEQGLLGLAFHPSFAQKNQFYVDYVADNPRRTVIAKYSVSADNPNQADMSSEVVLLEVNQPFANHNGGQIAFGPDGFLYIAFGDGGSAGDPYGNAQNLTSLLGKILRIDVDSVSPGKMYGIPSDNPFISNADGFREEIYAYGFRNPWRFSFDFQTGSLWVSDVGQGNREEVDIVLKGRNYGWNIMEGTACYSPSSNCNRTGLELPIWDYGHDVGISITGGFVYRGSVLNELVGSYIYGDFGSGRIWALGQDSANVTVNEELIDTSLQVPSFGVDKNNNLYICAFDGRIYRLVHVPSIENVSQQPLDNAVNPSDTVEVYAVVTDSASPIKRVVLNFTSGNLIWTEVNMTNIGGDIYHAAIPNFPVGTKVSYQIFALDYADNFLNTAQISLDFQYQVIPEFASPPLLAFLLTITLSAIFYWKKRKESSRPLSCTVVESKVSEG